MDNNNEIILAEDTLGKDLLAMVVEEIKHIQDPWNKIPEKRQDEVIRRLENRVRQAAATAVSILTDKGFPTLRGDVESVTFKDGVKAVIKTARYGEEVHALAEAAGSGVMIVIADPAEYCGGMYEVKPDPDQPDLVGEAA